MFPYFPAATAYPRSPSSDLAARHAHARQTTRGPKRGLEAMPSLESLRKTGMFVQKRTSVRSGSCSPKKPSTCARSTSPLGTPPARTILSISKTKSIAESQTKRQRTSSPTYMEIVLSAERPPASPPQPHSPLRKSYSSTCVPTLHPPPPSMMTRSITTPTTLAKKIHGQIDGVERLGEEMDKVFALVHGRGLRAPTGGGKRRESGLRNHMGNEGREGVEQRNMEFDA